MKKSVTFSSDGFALRGRLAVPKEGSPCVVALHGLFGGKDFGPWPVIASRLYDLGYSCFRFNFRGCGDGLEKSEGNFEDITLTQRIRDYRTALDFLREETVVDGDRLGTIGSSLGGMVAIASAESSVNAVVTMGSPYKVPRYDEPRIPKWDGDYYVHPAGRRFKKDFYYDIKQYDLREIVKESPPILFIQGGADEVVPIEHAQILYEHASEPKRLEIIDKADHLFTDFQCLEEAMDFAVDWFDEYL